MPLPIDDAVRDVHDFGSLLHLLQAELGWPVDAGATKAEATFDWTGDDLRLSSDAALRLKDGKVSQICPFVAGQPWGIFLVEFAQEKVYATALRQVLRRLTPSLRQACDLPAWDRENLLFICATRDYRRLSFVHFRGCPDDPSRAVMTAFGWEQGDSHIRTLCELNLPSLRFPGDRGADAAAWVRQWQSAWDVEKVTARFFKEYRQAFESVEAQVQGLQPGEDRRAFTQALFNRLLFLAFLQKKGWLNRDRRYLWGLYENAANHAPGRRAGGTTNFYSDYLQPLFFRALNTPDAQRAAAGWGELAMRLGDLPYLNGGLFDPQGRWDQPGAVSIPNEALNEVLTLFGHYNFTISESTPLDVEVAVDPEMLGRVFEELVTGRHETGSYYTPRPIVSFMCQEALKQYLAQALTPGATVADDIARFVEQADPAGLANPEAALDALRRIRVCDPACGSGAYLVGMMQELLRLREALFKVRARDAASVYQRKLEIIQRNLYGVDIDPFAVGIAMLRLWLSLVVDDTRDPVDDRTADVSLPNLKFKIQIGDSLTAPSPDAADSIFLHTGYPVFAGRLHDLHEEYFKSARAPGRRPTPAIEAEIAQVNAEIQGCLGSTAPAGALDWRVAFAEVFAHRGEETGGFDVVLANPPYLRQEVVKRQFGDAYKRLLATIYSEAYQPTADIYVAFYARAHQLLRPSGVGCFISSNKWLRAGYGEKLRHWLLDTQAFHVVADFGELPVFGAATFPAIFLWQKRPRDGAPTAWAVVKDLDACYAEGVGAHLRRLAIRIPASQFRAGGARLARAADADRKARMEASGPRLGEVVSGQIFRGVLTGLNEAFIVDQATRDALVAQDPRGAEILKPLLVGDDVRRYEVHFRQRHLIFTRRGIHIAGYPAILRHLERWREGLTPKQTGNEEHGRKPGDYEWYEIQDTIAYYAAFDAPKIVYPDIGLEPRFAMDATGAYVEATAFVAARADWYLLAVLNSRDAFSYLVGCASVLGDADKRGRVRFKSIYMETLPVPDAPADERAAMAALAQRAQELHGRRRARVEFFLAAVGLPPAGSSSRNPLAEPWSLGPEDFARRCRGGDARIFQATREETAALTEEIAGVEGEIDRHVAALYGVG